MSDTLGQWTLDTVVNTDALSLLRGLPDGSIDLVVTSPPYNLRNSTGNGLKATNNKGFWSNEAMRFGYENYTDDMPHDLYIAWQRECLAEMMRVLQPDGAVFYNHKWRVQGGLLQRLADDITAGFPVRQIIIWDRQGGFNFNDTYFLPTYEVIYLIAKPGFKLRQGENAQGDVWDIHPSENKAHPNAFPGELPHRCLQACYGSVVVDPFCGIGTTLVEAQRLGWHFIGCDISADYVAVANQRLAMPFTLPMFADGTP